MHVDDSVYLVLCACLDDAVEVMEALDLEYTGLVVILEMSVVHCYADAIQPEGLEEGGIRLSERVFKKLSFASERSVSH